MLGTPTVFADAIEQRYPIQTILLDANRQLGRCFPRSISWNKFIWCEITTQTLPILTGGVIIADPPWYPEYVRMFLWAASELCMLGGTLFLSFPPIGTRPGVDQEWVEAVDWARQLGFELSEVRKMSLKYSSPMFEQKALLAEGFANIRDWRSGDLAVFHRAKLASMPKPSMPIQVDQWVDDNEYGIRVKMKDNGKCFRDPSLISLLPGDVLTSVSRRDPRRDLADVWTSSNRIFVCHGPNLLCRILRATIYNLPVQKEVSEYLMRELNANESALVQKAVRQTQRLVRAEEKDKVAFRNA